MIYIDIFWFPEQRALVTFRSEPVTYLEAVWREVNSFSKRAPIDVLYTRCSSAAPTPSSPFWTNWRRAETRSSSGC